MLPGELIRRGEHALTICNACRYCEGYCPVFPAMERRLTFAQPDLTYLANLCHNCGECLYACQYAPPHEFALNIPRTLSEIRAASYEDCSWPRALGKAFRRGGVRAALALALVAIGAVAIVSRLFRPEQAATARSDFYAVVPHAAMVALFGAVMGLVVTALVIGFRRFWREQRSLGVAQRFATLGAIRDAMTLTHLHGNGADCTSGEEARSPLRRWFHHLTFYGFGLCVASTSVAAVYHSVLGWPAPYAYTSVPVVLGTAGGMGLLVGPIGLFALRRRRDPALGDPSQAAMDLSFIALLWLTTLTGLALLVARGTSAMAALLIVHLGFVLALFLTLPYGKFVHGIYRTAALVKYARESSAGERDEEIAAPDPTSPYEPVTAAAQMDAVVGVRSD